MIANRTLSVPVHESSPKSQDQQCTDFMLAATTRGGIAAVEWAAKGIGGELLGVNETIAMVREQAQKVADGDLDAAKGMLVAQAVTLDMIFNDLALRAATSIRTQADGSWSCNTEKLEAMMRIALKVQGQCRTTLQTLGELVNPRSVSFIKQAPGSQTNVAHGPQQVNNGVDASMPGAHAHAGKNEAGANKLLEANPSERLDTGAQGATGGANQVLEAVGAVHGAEVEAGKVRRLPKRA